MPRILVPGFEPAMPTEAEAPGTSCWACVGNHLLGSNLWFAPVVDSRFARDRCRGSGGEGAGRFRILRPGGHAQHLPRVEVGIQCSELIDVEVEWWILNTWTLSR